ncbi:MAG TPA: GAF domain-containing protein [Anaerolineales bacterium]|nr:GAF domain-containing protein [Anaerolineales bacterium]
MEHIRRFFAPPVFEDQFTTRRAGVINNILLIAILGGASVLLASLIQQDQGGIQLASVIVPLGIGLWLIFKRGNLVIPGLVFPFAIIVGLTYQIWRWGVGTSDEVMLAFPVVIALGSFMMGGRSPLLFTLAVNLVITATGLAEINGVLDHQYAGRTDYFDLFLFNAFIVMIGALLYVLLNSYMKNLELVFENERNLRETNEELQTARRNLEVRVAERTRDLTLSAEIGRAVAQERSLDVLLPNAVKQIREAFALYYAQIYLADPAGRSLILRAGSGTVGQELLRRGHRLPIASGSINGSAAFTKKSVLVEDTTKSESFLPNPLLPKTRSEMAIPLLSGERVLGVLNMQSEFPDTFTQETLPAYEILAGQLAAAIENAYQFTEIEKARAQVEAQSRLLTREGWDTYLDAVRQPEYFGMAYQDGEVASLSTPFHSAAGNEWVVPISVAGAAIGSIQLEIEDRTLSPEDQEVAIRLASLAGQHMENLRLLTEAERYRREAEQAARRLTREGWEAYQHTTGETVNGYLYANNRVKSLTQETATEPDIRHPLAVRGEPIGALELTLPEGENALDAETAELVATVADALTEHIENLRLTQATETALAQTETLYDVTTELTKAESLEQVLEAIASLRPGGRASMLAIDVNAKGEPEWLASTVSWPVNSSQVAPGERFPVMSFPISELWLKNPGKALLFGDIETEPRMDPQTKAINQQFGVKASVYLPLRVGNTWVGLITVSWDTPQSFLEADAQLFDAVAAQSAVVVNNRLLFEQSQKRAEREALINTINQRIQSATSVETALETTAREIGHLLKARRAVVEITSTPQNGL